MMMFLFPHQYNSLSIFLCISFFFKLDIFADQLDEMIEVEMAHGEPSMGMHCINGILKGKCFLHPPIEAGPSNSEWFGQDETIEVIKNNPTRRTVTFVNDHEQPFNVSLKSYFSNDKKFVVGFQNDLTDLLQLVYIDKKKRTQIALIAPNEISYQTIFLPIPPNCAYTFIKQNGIEVRQISVIKSAIQTASGNRYYSFVDKKRNVRLYNDHNQMVSVYWNPHPGYPLNNNLVYNGPIDPNSYVDQRTFYGHAFVFTLIGNDPENNIVREVIIQDEPILTVTGANPPKSALSQVSTQLIPPLPVLKYIVATLNPGDSKKIITDLYEEYIFTNIVTLKQSRTVQVIGPSRNLLYSVTGTHKDNPEWRNIWPRQKCQQYHHPSYHAGGIIELSSKFPFFGIPQIYLNLRLISLGRTPRAFTIDNLINDEEAQYIIERAKSEGLYDSVVGSHHGGETHQNRKSKNTFISKDMGLVKAVSSRVYEVLGVSYENGDQSCKLQVAYYTAGGQYRAHTDFFDPFQVGNEHEGKLQGGENRWATLIIYLNTPGSGGGTSFPDAYPANIVVKAEKGKGLLFYSMFENGNFDISSKHQGDIVEKGEKWIATYFCWDKLLPIMFD